MIGESGSGAHQGRDGWGWTADTYAWVEPTSRILLATKVVRPADTATRAEALALLRVRRCPDGGWNYGNASVNGVDLNAYAQTIAVALAALQGESPALIEPPLRFLRARWRSEPGGLTLAQTLIAFRLQGAEDEQELVDAIASTYRRTGFLGNVLALGWAVLATSPDGGLDRLRSSA